VGGFAGQLLSEGRRREGDLTAHGLPNVEKGERVKKRERAFRLRVPYFTHQKKKKI